MIDERELRVPQTLRGSSESTEVREPPADPFTRAFAGASTWVQLPEEPNLLLKIRDVETVRSAGNYCALRAGGRDFLVRVPLKTLEKRLGSSDFVRVHRTCLVNAQRIVRVVPEPNRRSPVACLDTGERVSVGRAYRNAVGLIRQRS